jgi:FkbM family methyltransferase
MIFGRILARVAPRITWRHRIGSWSISAGESEAQLLPDLVDRRKLSIDVGAAEGQYTALLVPLSKRVIAFEPAPQSLEYLRRMFCDTSVVEIQPIALSDTSGEIMMRVCPSSPWRSTIEAENTLCYTPVTEAICVRTRTLDEYELRGVGFIKIDVEGHEMAVLRGARRTIERDRPNVLIEVENQHKAGTLKEVFGFFREHGYSGEFFLHGELQPLERFDASIHQDVRNLNAKGDKVGVYINNFVFKSASSSAASFGSRSERAC